MSPEGNYGGGSRANTDTGHRAHRTWTLACLGTTKMFLKGKKEYSNNEYRITNLA